MDYKAIYKKWIEFATDEKIAAELLAIQNDEDEIKARFNSVLSFGTAGLRAKIGAGMSRMNIYTVQMATQGIADYLNAKGGGSSMAIAYDTRLGSDVFAHSAALVFAANGIKVYLFDSATSVAELSFAIRELKCSGGVAITASHNPKDYNGYKVYAPWGGQCLEHECEQISRYIGEQTDLALVKCADQKCAVADGMLNMIGADMDKKYYARLLSMTQNEEMISQYASSVKAVYTPLFGTGLRTFLRTIAKLPYSCSVVQSQKEPNSDFPGLDSPNPPNQRSIGNMLWLFEIAGG